MLRLEITDRTHTDFQNIVSYSTEEFGIKVADEYLQDIESALLLLQEHPGLLESKNNISEHFKLYRVRENFLIFSLLDDYFVLLTIGHAMMDLITRLLKLEPSLLKEVEILNSRLINK